MLSAGGSALFMPKSDLDATDGLDAATLVAVVDTAPDAIVVVDAEYRIVVFNAAAGRMFGYRAKDVLQQPLWRLLPPSARSRHDRTLDLYGATGVTARHMASSQVMGRRADGHEFSVEASISRTQTAESIFFTAILRERP